MATIESVTLRVRAAGGQVTLNGWCSIPEPTVAEIMALQPWDTMTVDVQHGLLDFQRALDLIRTIQGYGKPVLARIPSLEESWLVMKLLDAGAGGLICPNISTPQDAARFIAACTCPPTGNRSYGPTRAVLLDADYAKTADLRIIKAVQIEDDRSVASVNQIAAVAGLDMLYIGPADLSLAYGLPPRLDPEYPEVLAAYEAVIQACQARGLVAGIHCLTPGYAARMYGMGFRFMSIANDVRLFARAVAETVKETAGAIEEVRNARDAVTKDKSLKLGLDCRLAPTLFYRRRSKLQTDHSGGIDLLVTRSSSSLEISPCARSAANFSKAHRSSQASAAVGDLHEAFFLEPSHCLAKRGAADPKLAGEISFNHWGS